ncbi:MAG: questin oxidase family protein [Halopseudomonas aestusnigri]
MSVDHAEIYAPIFGPQQFSNHFPMASFALKKLGADEELIDRFNKDNLPRLDLNVRADNSLVITKDNFDLNLGKAKGYLGYLKYFQDKGCLGKELSRIDDLAKGVSASAFHALIRLGYGLDANDASEIAAGLAYMADTLLIVIPEENRSAVVSKVGAGDLGKKIIRKRLAGELEVLSSKATISGRMTVTAKDDERQNIISSAFNASNLSLDQVAKISLQVFLHTNSFTALHAVTASHAARLVLPYVGDQETFIRELFAGIVTAVLTIPGEDFKVDAFGPEELLSQKVLSSRGRVSTDSHDIKFIYSCLEEYREYSDPRYLAAAELRLNGW